MRLINVPDHQEKDVHINHIIIRNIKMWVILLQNMSLLGGHAPSF